MTSPRAGIVGLGLIGGSIGLALRRAGWHVTGDDHDPERCAKALSLQVVDEIGLDEAAELTFIATPVKTVVDAARRVLAAGSGLVTDVGSVKASVVDAVADTRFVGGHPMAGSELEGLAGADADLFEGAVWVLTPTPETDDAAYARIRNVVSGFGAEVVALPPAAHDVLVAVVSHVPHLTAAALMRIADARSEEHQALLRLAAGGFRDMTRIASGHPGIWPDICDENRVAITEGLDHLIRELQVVRTSVADGNRAELLDSLTKARAARLNLPTRYTKPADLAEVRIPVPDRPGVLADVTTLATELDVNIVDLEIAHSTEGQAGVLIVVIEATLTDLFRGGLIARGYRPAFRRLG